MAALIVLLVVGILVVLGVLLLRRAGGGNFPWLQFYLKGRESGFIFREINLLRRVAVDARLDNPTALFWSMKQLDRALKAVVVQARARSQEEDPAYNLLLAKLFELRKRVEFDQPKYKLGIKSSRKLTPNQGIRLTLPGIGPFSSIVVENLARYMAVSYPQGPKLPEGFSWKNQKVGVYFWRAEDAGYFFQTKVLEDFFDRKYPLLHVLHSDNLIRTQKRNSVRVETDMSAELFPLQTIEQASEEPENQQGLRSRLVDISEGGAAVLIGGKARVGLPVKMQFDLGNAPIVLSGVVKGANFDPKKNRSLLHIQATTPSVTVRNRILIYVYNLFGERETVGAARKATASPAAGGIILKASTPTKQPDVPADEAAGE
jgi:hypothetical protein